jgi:tetratricopeptide (TPR) repeat protein
VKFQIAILFILLLTGTLCAQPMDNTTFAKQYTLARVYEETRDLNNALRIYKELHKARPDATEVSEAILRDLIALKRYGEADTLLEERLTLEKENFDIYLNLAKVRAKLGKKTEALDAFEHALKAPSIYGNFSTVIAVAQTMIEAGYQEEALDMLIKQRRNVNENDQFTNEIAGLYFKLGKYEEGTKEYLGMLRRDEQTLSIIQQSVARFTADTTLRLQIIKIVTSHINEEKATPAELRLLSWCYGELKDYPKAYAVYLKLDDLAIKSGSQSAGGYELYSFAQRISREGAFEIASRAYAEAIRRFHNGAANDPQRKAFVSMAELGSLETKETYLRSLPDPPLDSLSSLASVYQNFAANQPNELALEALLHAGEIEFKVLKDFPKAKTVYENILTRSKSYSERTRDSYFALEEIAVAQGDLATAGSALMAISEILSKRKRPEDEETKKHIQLERAKLDYYNGVFDSALTKLDSIIVDPNSDYTNDAIALHSLISENQGNNAALRLFAKADLAALGKDLNAALSAYKSIPETYPSATIADESVLRAAEILIQLKRHTDALAMLSGMQEKMTTSSLLDKAAFREAQITETIIKDKAKALRMYEDFLERFPKSSLTMEARKKARTLRGDSF